MAVALFPVLMEELLTALLSTLRLNRTEKCRGKVKGTLKQIPRRITGIQEFSFFLMRSRYGSGLFKRLGEELSGSFVPVL